MGGGGPSPPPVAGRLLRLAPAMRKRTDEPVDRWVEDNRLAPNRAAYGVVAFLLAAVVAVVLLVWLL